MPISVRRVRAGEWRALRALRLRALAEAPNAFGSTLARESAFPDDTWRERAAAGAAGLDRVTFIAEREDGQWCGLATGLADDPAPGAATLVGMFVAPEARGQGAAVALVEAVAEWARERNATRLDLFVTGTNSAAIALYRRCGFIDTGAREPLPHTPSLMEWGMSRALRP